MIIKNDLDKEETRQKRSEKDYDHQEADLKSEQDTHNKLSPPHRSDGADDSDDREEKGNNKQSNDNPHAKNWDQLDIRNHRNKVEGAEATANLGNNRNEAASENIAPQIYLF